MKIAKLAMCGVAIISLAGCQNLLADLGIGPKKAKQSQLAAGDSERMELGREALRAGAPGNAIHHFERALLDPATAPEAYNGMGIAYAQLGRADLAERFFNVAIMLKPSDERFARNLNRLYQSDLSQSALAKAEKQAETDRQLADAAEAAAVQGLVPTASRDFERRGAVVIGSRKPTLDRKARGMVAISTVPENSVSAPSVDVVARTSMAKPRVVEADAEAEADLSVVEKSKSKSISLAPEGG